MTRSLSRSETTLINLGHQSLLERLLAGPLPFPVRIKFETEKQAKQFTRNFYAWTWFHPQVKERISTSIVVSEVAGYYEVVIRPRGIPEKRGRKGAKLG